MNDYVNNKWKNFLRGHSSPQPLTEDVKYGTKKRGKTIKPSKVEKRTLNIPYPKISDSWGEPGNKDRAEVEELLSRVATGNTWQEKINKLNDFANSCKNQSSCLRQADSTILSKLMAMDVLTSIVYDFDASSAGFLFEAFLAALLGGDSEKIAASQSRKAGEGGDIADVILLGEPFSLKLLRKGASSIDGSYKDLIASVARNGKPVNYMVALKDLKGKGEPVIRFYELTIGSSAFRQDENGNLVHNPEFYGESPNLAGYIDVDDPNLGVIKGTEFHVPTSILRGTTASIKTKKKKTDKRENPKLKRRKKALQAKEFKKETATLSLGSKESLEELANAYAQKMSDDIVAIYDALDGLSQNINKYLIGKNMGAGKQATQRATTVAQKTDKLVKDQENPSGS
jgi:hypothetical protein